MASMASKISSSSNTLRDLAQQRHAFFDQQDHIPEEILLQIKNPQQAKEVSFFLYERKERITGVSISSEGYLSKIFTVSQDNIKRIWSKKLRTKKQTDKEAEQFFIYAEIKRPSTVETRLTAISSAAPSTTVD